MTKPIVAENKKNHKIKNEDKKEEYLDILITL